MNPVILVLASLISLSAFAETESLDFNTNDYPGSYCRVEMRMANGGFLQAFEAGNCDWAMRQCQRALDDRHRQGLNPYARCEVVNNGGGGYNPPGYPPGYPPRYPPYNPPNNPPPYPPYNPPRQESWTCVANDSGTEEHYGGHAGYGRSQVEAAENAIRICKLSHGDCYIAHCSAN